MCLAIRAYKWGDVPFLIGIQSNRDQRNEKNLRQLCISVLCIIGWCLFGMGRGEEIEVLTSSIGAKMVADS